MHLQDLLTRQGYEIAAAVSSGEAALQTAQRKKPSLILMDVELNGEMNGIQAAKEFSTKTDIPVIFLTSYSQDSLLQQAKIAAPYGLSGQTSSRTRDDCHDRNGTLPPQA